MRDVRCEGADVSFVVGWFQRLGVVEGVADGFLFGVAVGGWDPVGDAVDHGGDPALVGGLVVVPVAGDGQAVEVGVIAVGPVVDVVDLGLGGGLVAAGPGNRRRCASSPRVSASSSSRSSRARSSVSSESTAAASDPAAAATPDSRRCSIPLSRINHRNPNTHTKQG
jgi:hypothetical protein